MMKKYKWIIVLFLIAVSLEIIVFNFNSILSLTYQNIDYKVYYSENLTYKDGSYKIANTGYSYNPTIELYDISGDVKNIYLDAYTQINKGEEPLSFTITLSDEGSETLYWNVSRLLVNNIGSKYIKINSSGQTKKIVIEFDKDTDLNTFIYNISLNQRRPFAISVKRIFIIFAILSLFYIFSGKKHFYDFKNAKFKKVVTIIIILTQIFLLYKITTINPNYVLNQNQNDSNFEYQSLAHSFTNGYVYLDNEVSQQLQDMENPYDHLARVANNVAFNLDFCYFNGKYYVYFGVVPEIIFFLPYYLLTGSNLMNFQAIFISLAFFIVGIFLLLNTFIKKYFPKTPYIMYILLSTVLIFCSGIIELAKNPSVYAIPIASGLAFMVWGLYFWLKATEKVINKKYLLIGSLLMALVFGCRPQLGISSLLAFIIFKDYLKKYKLIFIGLLPYFFIGIMLMYYNYIRFQSPFDFGANYNLTFNDMTHRGFKLDRIGLGIFTYLFQPFVLTATFPFVLPVTTTYNYIGIKIYENTFGGLFSWFPMAILPIFVYKFKNMFVNKKIYFSVIVLSLISLVLLIFDVEAAGIVQRYFADFSIFMLMAVIIILLVIINKYNNGKVNYLIFIFCLLGIIYSFLLIFVTDFANISIANPDFYYNWYYLLQPWL